MESKAYYVILENYLLLSKKPYNSWREIQEDYETYKASFGPFTKQELLAYMSNDYKAKDFPFDSDRIAQFYAGSEFILYETGSLESSDFKPVEPWVLVTDEATRLKLTAEVEKEIHPEHVLWGKKFSIVGRRVDQDDVALHLNKDCQIAFVHLTWKGSREQDIFPVCEILLTLDELVKQQEYDRVEYGE